MGMGETPRWKIISDKYEKPVLFEFRTGFLFLEIRITPALILLR
jgi:hypothetical protein